MVTARLELPAEPDSVAAARSFVERALVATPAQTRRDEATLLVSELVTNAVLYARSAVEIRVSTAEGGVVVEVRDDSPRLPRLMNGVGESMAGRGLHIVDTIADAWGTEPDPAGGKVVWFQLAYHRH